MLYSNEWDRLLLEEERKLMREVSSQRMNWSKFFKLVQLNALLRTHRG